MTNTVEEAAAQKAAAEQEVKEQVEQAGEAAKHEAEKQGLTPEEAHELVERARKEEKDKLYPKIEELTARTKELQDFIRKQEEDKEAEEQKKEEANEKRRLAKLSEEERRSEQLNNLEEQLKLEREARERLEAQQARDKRQAQLDEYRKAALRAAGNDIISELVYGDSEEEIDKSVTRAKARYKEIEEKLKEERGQEIKNNLSSTSPDTEALAEEELEQRLSAVDTDKYMKDPEYREKLQSELADAYGRAMGR